MRTAIFWTCGHPCDVYLLNNETSWLSYEVVAERSMGSSFIG
jgi:hypothetical protein